MLTFNQTLQLVNTEIDKLNWARDPKGLYEPIGYILSLGGKRIRPAVTLMACNLYTDNPAPAIKPALGLEVFHNFTLLHDDIMDRAEMRRGKPTVNKKWNDNTAILSGDVMQIEAYKLMTETPPEHLKNVLTIFSTIAAEICEGQQYDMEFEQRNNVSADDYLEMIRLKTAVLIAGSAKIGAIIGGSSPHDAEQLYNYGNNIGLAFQLKDDLLDVYGAQDQFGKKIGGDILCNKKTYLLIHALNTAKGTDAQELHYWLNNNNPDQNNEKITAITTLYNRLDAKAACEAQMELYYHRAMESLRQVDAPQHKKTHLSHLAEKLMDRND